MSVCVSVQSLNTTLCLFILNSSSMSILLIDSESGNIWKEILDFLWSDIGVC